MIETDGRELAGKVEPEATDGEWEQRSHGRGWSQKGRNHCETLGEEGSIGTGKDMVRHSELQRT